MFSAKHRMNRPSYWFCYVVVVLVVSFFAYIGKLSGGLEIIMVVIGVPRLHDIGRSGWIIGGVILAEVTLVIGALLAGASADTLSTIGGAFVLAVAALGIWLGVIPGEPGPNKWGEPPKAGIQFGRRKGAA